MFVYCFLLAIIWISYPLFKKYGKQKLQYNYFIGLLFFLLIVLRSKSVGGDLVNYLPVYHRIGSMSLKEAISQSDFEIGFVFLNKMISLLGGSERVYLVIVGFLSIIGVFVFINRFSDIPWLSWTVYICMGFLIYPLSGLRAAIAMSFGLIAMVFLNEEVSWKNVWKYYFFALLAFLFHKTSCIYLLLYPLCKIKNRRIANLLIAGLGGVFFVFGDTILQLLISRYYHNYSLNYNGGIVRMAFFVLVYIVGELVCVNKCESKFIVLSRTMLLVIVFQILTLKLDMISRMVEFLFVSSVIYIPYIVNYFQKKDRIFFSTLVTCGCLYFFYMFLVNDGAGIIPYSFFF